VGICPLVQPERESAGEAFFIGGNMSIRDKKSPEERFWINVKKTESCWLWTAFVAKNGYGQFSYDGKSIKAHRFAYELTVGKIPDGLQIDHRCRVRNCVNPNHLEAVTQRENILRGTAPTAVNARKTHCPSGHEYTEDNTLVKTTGARICRTCHNFNKRRKYRESRGKNEMSIL
jgi:hypothetical protein